jgi:3-dehydroquinate synthase
MVSAQPDDEMDEAVSVELVCSSQTLALPQRDLAAPNAYPKQAGLVKIPVIAAAANYELSIGSGLFEYAAQDIQRLAVGPTVFLVTDRNVGPLYGPRFAKLLHNAGFKGGQVIELPPGEGAKTWEVAGKLLDQCFGCGLDRSSTMLALGGGVIGDLTGFVSAIFMRGIHYVQIPTTLLAQVDASVGGKTAVDHAAVKNGIGAFHQPKAVYADTDTLKTLPPREYRAGLAEIVKYGVAQDAMLFEFLENNVEAVKNGDGATMTTVIARACEIKAATVAADEFEAPNGVRGLLNFGHTFGHALETATEYQKYLHGEGVAIGMVLAARAAAAANMAEPNVVERLTRLLETFELPTGLTEDDPKADALFQLMFRDKKTRAGKLRLVLPTAIGESGLYRGLSDETILRVLTDERRKRDA